MGRPWRWATKELTSWTADDAVEVTGMELTLVVEFGGGDVCDHVNWAEARVVK